MQHKLFTFYILSVILFSCTKEDKKVHKTPFDQSPSWASTAIWYQIFPERFCNGDEQNDPTHESIRGALFDSIPNTWSVTPWTHEWYKQEDWAKQSNKDFYTTIQMRRYGGDLKGVLDKIPYLKSLGVNAIYFNPLNDAPSLHKYDARNFHHIDVTFGKGIALDNAIIAQEDPSDPKTWKFTTADSLFIKLIDALHKENIRVVMDYSWNHTGTQFWAFKDLVKNQKQSKYKDWYEITKWDDSTTEKNEFEYEGWIGVKSLPELKKIRNEVKRPGHPFEGNMQSQIVSHIQAVTKRWMDPNGDGNPNDGIDGMRLDVAEHVPLGFWRDYRKYVRAINPDFFLIGENWWTKWPDTLMDAVPWMKGDIFDAVMHYQWFKPARYAFIGSGSVSDISTFYTSIDSIYSRYRPEVLHSLMNLGSSHDTERMLTALANSNKYKYKSNPRDTKEYICWQPDSLAYQRMKALTLHQFTFVGAPHIFNGDEMAMYGGDDPDNRKPIWWSDLKFENENYTIQGKNFHYTPQPNYEMIKHYKELCNLRKSNAELCAGTYTFLQKEFPQLIAYKRTKGKSVITVLINPSKEVRKISLSSKEKILFQTGSVSKDKDGVIFGPYAGIVLK